MIDYEKTSKRALAAYDYMRNPAIPDEEKPKLFDPYWVAWEPVQRAFDGMTAQESSDFMRWLEDKMAEIDHKYGFPSAEELARGWVVAADEVAS